MSNPRFSIIPAGAVTDRSLEPRDLQVLCLLGRHTEKDSGWCRRSQVKMAVELDCGRASVQRSLERLVEAGWLQKKRPPWSNESGQPSNSYMYRVVLDRDDFDIEATHEDDAATVEESHAPDALQEAECPPVGSGGAQQDGHPGAQPYVGTGAQPYVGTKNVPLERPPIERERDARARERTARFIVDFEKRWPTAAVDDRQRTAYAAEALTEHEQQAAIASIAAYLEKSKRSHRKHVPAGWRYLEEKRWTLLEQPAEHSGPTAHARDTIEAKAIRVLFDLAGALDFFVKVIRKNDVVYYRHPVTPQLLKLHEAKPREEWPIATRNQAGSWNSFLDKYPTIERRKRLVEGDAVPFEWAPKSDGTLSPATGPPLGELSEQDAADFRA